MCRGTSGILFSYLESRVATPCGRIEVDSFLCPPEDSKTDARGRFRTRFLLGDKRAKLPLAMLRRDEGWSVSIPSPACFFFDRHQATIKCDWRIYSRSLSSRRLGSAKCWIQVIPRDAR